MHSVSELVAKVSQYLVLDTVRGFTHVCSVHVDVKENVVELAR